MSMCPLAQRLSARISVLEKALSNLADEVDKNPLLKARNAARRTLQSPYVDMLITIATFKGSRGALLNWWRSQASTREGMAFEESGCLGKIYNAKFNELDE